MKVRKRVKFKHPSQDLTFDHRYWSFKDNLRYNAHLFSGLNFYLLLTALLIPVVIFRPALASLVIANVLLLTGLYLMARRRVEGLQILRKVPAVSREGEELPVTYVFSNASGFSLDEIHFVQEFDGTQAGQFAVSTGRDLPAQTSFEVRSRVRLNSGMGVKTFKPIRLLFRDPLRIFEFEVEFDQTQEVEVYPKLQELPPLKAAISPDSITFGLYEIPNRGESSLFIGTREYRHGDPVRHINWKLSRRSGKIIVNEFEKNTNAHVTLLLDLELDHQIGRGSVSTWEGVKDLALGIAAAEIEKHNQLQLIANNLYVPFGTGHGQLVSIERHFTLHELAALRSDQHLVPLQHLPSRGQVYFICPMYTSPHLLETFETLKRLAAQDQRVVVFLVDPYQALLKEVNIAFRSSLLEVERHVRGEFVRIERELVAQGIRVVKLRISEAQDFGRQLRSEAFDLLELA
jgi:uncharacterized protein (DUF58 family)